MQVSEPDLKLLTLELALLITAPRKITVGKIGYTNRTSWAVDCLPTEQKKLARF